MIGMIRHMRSRATLLFHLTKKLLKKFYYCDGVLSRSYARAIKYHLYTLSLSIATPCSSFVAANFLSRFLYS